MDGSIPDARGAENYRMRAQLARQLGEKATTQAGRLWLKVAERFEAMAELLERHRAS
jgi:hypothetical protein